MKWGSKSTLNFYLQLAHLVIREYDSGPQGFFPDRNWNEHCVCRTILQWGFTVNWNPLSTVKFWKYLRTNLSSSFALRLIETSLVRLPFFELGKYPFNLVYQVGNHRFFHENSNELNLFLRIYFTSLFHFHNTFSSNGWKKFGNQNQDNDWK